jgi:signal transduction histidine kinase
MTPTSSTARHPQALQDLPEAHKRFVRAALLLYLAAAAIAVLLLVTSLVTDRSYEENQVRERLLLETEVRAQFLARHLGLLVRELNRLGLRSEVNLLDHNPEPERSLLRLSHDSSTFFNVGVAILGVDGRVVWAVPAAFRQPGNSFASEPWFAEVKKAPSVRIVPVRPDRDEDALLYVVSPIIRDRALAGFLLGAVDLARGDAMGAAGRDSRERLTLLATRRGAVVYPPRQPDFASEPAWKRLFEHEANVSRIVTPTLTGRARIVAESPVASTGMILLTMADRQVLFADARTRMVTRLAVGLLLATAPLVGLVLLLLRSLRALRRAEENARREERLRKIGEATNLIAHEVKNALNGLRLGIDVLLRSKRQAALAEGAAPPEEGRVVGTLRKEIQRLSEFTTELLTFSKGIVPRPVEVDLVDHLHKVTAMTEETAKELGVEIAIHTAMPALRLRADPTLLHIVVSNLLANALDAVTTLARGGTPRIDVRIEERGPRVEVRVADNGPGVSEAVRERLFEPFVTGKPSGVGIGLSLSQRIAHAHGGELILETASPSATFLLVLPKEPS